jgi:hypothetical protein
MKLQHVREKLVNMISLYSNKIILLDTNIYIIKKKCCIPFIKGNVIPNNNIRFNIFLIAIKRFSIYHICIAVWDLKYNTIGYHDSSRCFEDIYIYKLLKDTIQEIYTHKTPFIIINSKKFNDNCAINCIKFVQTLI